MLLFCQRRCRQEGFAAGLWLWRGSSVQFSPDMLKKGHFLLSQSCVNRSRFDVLCNILRWALISRQMATFQFATLMVFDMNLRLFWTQDSFCHYLSLPQWDEHREVSQAFDPFTPIDANKCKPLQTYIHFSTCLKNIRGILVEIFSQSDFARTNRPAHKKIKIKKTEITYWFLYLLTVHKFFSVLWFS